tara:strand:- start:10533 stop:10688 length:156 start_codon:yes stop_codon:yes gene_type:complete
MRRIINNDGDIMKLVKKMNGRGKQRVRKAKPAPKPKKAPIYIDTAKQKKGK